MKHFIFPAVVLVLCFAVGCPQAGPAGQQSQSFCVQYSNTTGFAGQGGRTVVFTAFDANSRSTQFVVPIEYETIQADGSTFVGSQFTFDPPANAGSAFASNVLQFNGVPPIEFSASIQSESMQEMSTVISCSIPNIMGIGGQLSLGTDVWRVEVTSRGTIECVNDQGPCN